MDLFPGVVVRDVSTHSEEGGNLVDQYGVVMLPTYILSSGFAESPRFFRLRRMVVPIGGDFFVGKWIVRNSFWFRCQQFPDLVDVLLPFEAFSTDMKFADVFKGERVDLRIHYAIPPALSASDRKEFERRAFLDFSQPNRYPIYLTVSNRALVGEGRYDWRAAATAAGVEEPHLSRQLRSGVGIELLKQGVAMRDSLELLLGDSALPVENQLLTRDVTPDQLIAVRTSRNPN